jgi:hypothetical protein
MATLQVTAWQLWGTHHKTGSMEHNQDTDAPVPADELLESPAILTRFSPLPSLSVIRFSSFGPGLFGAHCSAAD